MVALLTEYWPIVIFGFAAIVAAAWWFQRQQTKATSEDLSDWTTRPPSPTEPPYLRPRLRLGTPNSSHPPLVHDNLTRIRGLSPMQAVLLNDIGVSQWHQIAILTDADVAAVEKHLGKDGGTAISDRWVEQARMLAAQDFEGHEAMFGTTKKE